MTNKIKRIVRDVDQPVRQSKSAKSIETNPVSTNAEVKKMNSRQPRAVRGGEAEMIFASAMAEDAFYKIADVPDGIKKWFFAVRKPENQNQ